MSRNLFRDYLLHAKNVSVDDAVGIIGSSNVDLRSFQLNEEVSLLLHDRSSIAVLTAVLASYLANSDTLERNAGAGSASSARISRAW